jgi:hypothetical protein
LITYGQSEADHSCFTTHFIDGLKDDIKSIVLVQCPIDLDTDSTLALLQEEADSAWRKDFRKADYVFKHKSMDGPSPLPLPLPPLKSDKAPTHPPVAAHSTPEVVVGSTADNNVAALHAYKKARGLRQYCAEKYFRDHKCASIVQLPAVQEMWELLSVESDQESIDAQSDTEALLQMLLSAEAVSSGTSAKVLKFQEEIQGHYVIISINSGSSHSFVNAELAPLLLGMSAMPSLVNSSGGQ